MYFLRTVVFLLATALTTFHLFAEAPLKQQLKEPSLQLNPALFESQQDNVADLKKDPFHTDEFLKSVNLNGTFQLVPSYRKIKFPDRYVGVGSREYVNAATTDGDGFGNGAAILADEREEDFSFFSGNVNTPVMRLRISARLTRTLNASTSFAYFTNMNGFNQDIGNPEERRLLGSVRVGGFNVTFDERTPIGTFSVRVSNGVTYSMGRLSNGRIGPRNVNFRQGRFDELRDQPRADFNFYERIYLSNRISSNPDVSTTNINFINRTSGLLTTYQSNRGGIKSGLLIGITAPNRALRAPVEFPEQWNSTTVAHRISKELRVNILGKRATHDLGLNNVMLFGKTNDVNGDWLNLYTHSITFGPRSRANGSPLSNNLIQPNYEVALFRRVGKGDAANGNYQAKGFILENTIAGSEFGVKPMDINFTYFHIDSGFHNPNAGIYQTSASDFINGIDEIAPLSLYANNRRGGEVNISYEFFNLFTAGDRFRVTAGNSISRHLTNPTDNRMIYRVNINSWQVARSLTGQQGPENYYRAAGTGGFPSFITRTDRNSDGDFHKLYFNRFEIDLKYLGKINFKKFLLAGNING